MAIRPTSYVPHRWFIYSLLWACAVVELALTAFRIRHTNSLFGFYDPIVAELLVTSILTILWVPMTLLFHRSADTRDTAGTGMGAPLRPRHGETGGNFVLWVMWLVGAAIATHKWPTRGVAAAAGERDIITSLVAFAWICFGLLTLAKILGLMEYAAIRAANAGTGVGYTRGGYNDKTAGATTAPGIGGGNAGAPAATTGPGAAV